MIVIPAYNEEKSIYDVVMSVKSLGENIDVLVVNDGSDDNTESRARKAGAKVINLPINLGIGGAVQTGYRGVVRVLAFGKRGSRTAACAALPAWNGGRSVPGGAGAGTQKALLRLRKGRQAGPTGHVPGRIDGGRKGRLFRDQAALAGKIAVQGEAGRQFGVEDRDEDVRRFSRGDVVVDLEQDFDPRPDMRDLGGPDEGQGDRVRGHLRDHGLGGKTIQLAAETVALHGDVDEPEVRRLAHEGLRDENGPGAGPPELHAPPDFPENHLVEAENGEQPGNARAFAAGQDESGDVRQRVGGLDPAGVDAQTLQMIEVFLDAALEVENPDLRRTRRPDGNHGGHLTSPVRRDAVLPGWRRSPGQAWPLPDPWRPPGPGPDR